MHRARPARRPRSRAPGLAAAGGDLEQRLAASVCSSSRPSPVTTAYASRIRCRTRGPRARCGAGPQLRARKRPQAAGEAPAAPPSGWPQGRPPVVLPGQSRPVAKAPLELLTSPRSAPFWGRTRRRAPGAQKGARTSQATEQLTPRSSSDTRPGRRRLRERAPSASSAPGRRRWSRSRRRRRSPRAPRTRSRQRSALPFPS